MATAIRPPSCKPCWLEAASPSGLMSNTSRQRRIIAPLEPLLRIGRDHRSMCRLCRRANLHISFSTHPGEIWRHIWRPAEKGAHWNEEAFVEDQRRNRQIAGSAENSRDARGGTHWQDRPEGRAW